MVDEAIDIVIRTVTFCLDKFWQLLEATGTRRLWLAGIGFVLFVSIILMPFRGGHPVGGGSFGEFLANKISSGRANARREQERAERKRFFRRSS